MAKQLMYDLETTGLDFNKHAIHQMSGIVLIDGVEKEKFDFRMAPHPTALIEPKALEVSNVTLEQIQAYPDNIMTYKEIVLLLGKYVNKFNKLDKFQLIGYNNVKFDGDFLRAYFAHCGDKYFGSWFWNGSSDVMVLAADYLQDERHLLENFQLRTVAKHLGIEVDESKLHDAQYDIHLTWEVYKIVTHKKPV